MATARTKGSHVLLAVKTLRTQRELVAKLLPQALHKYLDERILVSSWYPLADHLHLLRALNAVLSGGKVADETWDMMGRINARMDMGGVYRAHLKPGDAARSLEVLGAVWRSTHDTGEVALSDGAPGRLRVHVRHFAAPAIELCQIITGYLAEVVMLAENKKARVVHERCRLRGASECVYSVTWDPA